MFERNKDWDKKLKEDIIDRFLSEKAKNAYDELDWAKDIYFDVLDYIEANIKFLNEILEEFFVIGTSKNEYHNFTDGISGYKRAFKDLKEKIKK